MKRPRMPHEIDRVGLKNVGNSCSMNAVIQCLAATPFRTALPRYAPPTAQTAPTYPRTVMAIRDVVQRMNGTSNCEEQLLHLREILGETAPRFGTREQQCAADFLMFALEQMERELTVVSGTSVLAHIFTFETTTRLTCPNTRCDGSLVRPEQAWLVAAQIEKRLPLRQSVRSCIGNFTSPSVLDESEKWLCNGCATHVRARNSITIETTPKVLVVFLKRFITGWRNGRMQSEKIHDEILMENNLEINGTHYWMSGVVHHHGHTMERGHYTAEFFGPDGRWTTANDTKITEFPQKATSKTAFLVFYCRSDFPRPSAPSATLGSEARHPPETGAATMAAPTDKGATESLPQHESVTRSEKKRMRSPPTRAETTTAIPTPLATDPSTWTNSKDMWRGRSENRIPPRKRERAALRPEEHTDVEEKAGDARWNAMREARTRIGTWNTRTAVGHGRKQTIIRVMIVNGFHMLGLQETRGKIGGRWRNHDGWRIDTSGGDKDGNFGVGFSFSPEIEVLEIFFGSCRTGIARIRHRGHTFWVANVYAKCGDTSALTEEDAMTEVIDLLDLQTSYSWETATPKSARRS